MGAKLAYTENGIKYIAHLTSLGMIALTNGEIDVTDHDSPGGSSESIPGEKTHDNVPFAGNIVAGDSSFARLWALGQSRVTRDFTASYADGTTMNFEAYVANCGIGEQTTDGLMGYEGELKITGEVTYAGVASS